MPFLMILYFCPEKKLEGGLITTPSLSDDKELKGYNTRTSNTKRIALIGPNLLAATNADELVPRPLQGIE